MESPRCPGIRFRWSTVQQTNGALTPRCALVRSKREAELDLVLIEMFPAYTMLQDYAITVGRKTLYIDRVVVGPNIAIEVDGKQHEVANEFFHRDKEGFYKSKDNDR